MSKKVRNHSWIWPILHPSFTEIWSVVFWIILILFLKPTNQHDKCDILALYAILWHRWWSLSSCRWDSDQHCRPCGSFISKWRQEHSDCIMLEVLRVNTTFWETAFSFSTPYTWNIFQRTFNLDKVITIGQFETMITNCSAFEWNCF